MARVRQNDFCKFSSLRTESDVEQTFIVRVLDRLGFTEDFRETKAAIPLATIGKGRRRRAYRPDYVCYIDRGHHKPVLVIDAKAPNVDAEEGVQDAQLYASVIRRALKGPKPHQFCLGSNGHITIVKSLDSNDTVLQMPFGDFCEMNTLFSKLLATLSRERLKDANIRLHAKSTPWKPRKPSIEEIKATFQKCHNQIWKRAALFLTAAFYAFTKLIFLKLREDERLHRIMDAGKEVYIEDLYFHTEWIDQHSEVSPNPIDTILFRRLTETLAEQVATNRRKYIFESNEPIKLKPSIVRSVVELLQDYDLSEIDEDLNGRMFEVFLSAAVRGKNLGAFFTPRNIVELMVQIVSPTISRRGGNTEIETVLDGCCGSGGFLIDVMADMLRQIRTNPALSANRRALEERLLRNHIYGIESNPDIARIARINMFLHGDGGSRIYHADALDKEFQSEEGESRQARDEVNALRRLIVEDGVRFDAVLTNPPFATAYTTKDTHEKRILEQYSFYTRTGSEQAADSPGEPATPPRSCKSNVRFLARYYDLLRPCGRMVIVPDNSMLNSHTFVKYRVWLRAHYIIRAIIGLPKYSFIQAGAGGVTSILYLEKRRDSDQRQPPIFARAVHYTGLSQSGKVVEENDLPDVLAEWKAFERSGKLFARGVEPIGEKESDALFVIHAEEITDRLDVAYHTPSFKRVVAKIDAMAASGSHEVKTVSEFARANTVDAEAAGDEVFKYVDIGAIDAERCRIVLSEIQEGTLEGLSDRARIQIRENDVLFPLSFDSLGKVAIVPRELDGQLASTGFVAIRNASYDDAVFLWALLRSEIMQKQFRHLASGYTQRGILAIHEPQVGWATRAR